MQYISNLKNKTRKTNGKYKMNHAKREVEPCPHAPNGDGHFYPFVNVMRGDEVIVKIANCRTCGKKRGT